jgi:hypothetical protein
MASESFALDVSRWVERAKAQPELVLRKVALDVQRRVMERTPVDTGRARAGWGLSMTGTHTAVIHNSVEYIIPLEYGHSKQAPAGMVRPTIAEFSQIVADAA